MNDTTLICRSADISSLGERTIHDYLEQNIKGLFSIDEETRKNVMQLYKALLVSTFSVCYATKLNMLIEKKALATSPHNRKKFSEWFNEDVIEMVEHFSEKDFYDDPKTILAISEVLVELQSSLDCIDEEDVVNEMDYVLDFPYRAMEIMSNCKDIPKMETLEFKSESIKIRLTSCSKKMKISSTIRNTYESKIKSNTIKWILK
jgi:hypothetical protein